MSTLAQFILDQRIDPVKAMNTLQNFAVISDNCVGPEDVAEADCPRAIQFITGLSRLKLPEPLP